MAAVEVLPLTREAAYADAKSTICIVHMRLLGPYAVLSGLLRPGPEGAGVSTGRPRCRIMCLL